MRTGEISGGTAKELLGTQFLFRYKLIDELAASLDVATPSTIVITRATQLPSLTSRAEKLINNLIVWRSSIDNLIAAREDEVLAGSENQSIFAGPEPPELTAQQRAFTSSLEALYKASMYKARGRMNYFLHNTHLVAFIICWQAAVCGTRIHIYSPVPYSPSEQHRTSGRTRGTSSGG